MRRLMVVGLGNPGAGYRDTRHNLGFRVADYLAGSSGGRLKNDWRRQGRALVAEVLFKGCPVVLVKPQAYVNRSGEPLAPLAARLKIPSSRILVVCDDLALPLGKLRLRTRGSSGGHNGLQSIIDFLGEDFPRLRVGIGAPGHPGGWSEYVLAPFSPEEAALLPEIIERAAGEVISFLNKLRSEEEQ